MTFVKMDQTAEGGFHEDILEGRPWNREETSVITSGGFQPMVWEVANLETRFRGGNLALQLSIGGLLRVSEEGLKNL